MRILLVSRIFAPEPSAASERLGALATALVDGGDHVTVLTTRPPVAHRSTTVGAGGRLRIRRMPVLRDRAGYVRGYIPYLSFDVPAFFRILFSRADVGIVEPPPTTGFFARIAFALRRTPYVYFAADIWSRAAVSTGAPRWVIGVVRTMERFALRGAAAVIAVSDGVAEHVRELAGAVPVTVVGHGVDTDTFAAVEQSGDRWDAVYVGTASEWHGAGVLLDALAVLPVDRPLRIRFVGHGGEWDQLRERARQLAPHRIEFTAALPAAEAAEVLGDARVALSTLRPGIGYDFAIPTKSYSALSVGTPVLYAGPGTLRDTLSTNDLGHGVDYDASAIADALALATSQPVSPERRRGIASWARRHLSAQAAAERAAAVVRASAVSVRGGRIESASDPEGTP